MAKAKTAEVQAEAEALQITPPAPRKKRGKPVAIEVHEVKTVWSEEKVIGDKPKASPPKRREPEYEPEEEDEEEDDYEGLPDGLADFLRSQGESSSDVLMEVRYIKDANGARAGIRDGLYCGTFNFDFNTYLDDLALMECTQPGKPARFVLRLKQDGRYLPNGTLHAEVLGASFDKKLAAGTITNLPQSTAQNHAPQSQVIVQPPVIDEDAIIDREFARLERLKKLLGGNGQRDEGSQLRQPELTEEAILLKAAMASPEAKEKVANGIGKLVFGGAIESAKDEAPYWFEPAVSILGNFMQAIAPGVNSLLQVTAQAKQVEIQRIQQPVINAPEGMAAIPPPAPMPEPEPIPAQPPQSEAPTMPTVMDLYIIAFRAVLNVRQLPAPLNLPRKAARALLDLVDNNSVETASGPVSPFDSVVTDFLETEPAQLLTLAETFAPDAAETIKAPDAAEWVKAVQDELRKEWESDGENNETN